MSRCFISTRSPICWPLRYQEHDVAANGNSSTAPLVDTTAMTSPTPEPRPWPCAGHALSWIGAATGSARYPPTTDREVWWPASSSPREARVRRGDTGCNFTAPDKVADEVEILASRDTGCNFATPHKVADWIYTSSICPTSCDFRPPYEVAGWVIKAKSIGGEWVSVCGDDPSATRCGNPEFFCTSNEPKSLK